MKTLKLLLLLIVTPVTINAQSWQWARVEQQTNGEGFSMCKDPSGNVFLTGTVTGPGAIATTTYGPGVKSYVNKYDGSGNLLWTYIFPTNSGFMTSIACDNSGNVYVTAIFTGNVLIGSNTYGSAGGADIYILKLDNTGNLIWVRTVGSPWSEYALSIATDGAGNSVITGYFIHPTLTFGNTTLTNNGGVSYFVTKYDTNGNVLWATSAVGTGFSLRANAVALDASLNVYVTGTYDSQIVANTTTLNSAGGTDVFVARYSPTGSLLWLVSTGSTYTETANGIKIDPTGNIYLAGSIKGPASSVGTATFNTGAGQDAYLAKFNNNGNFLWTRTVGASGNEVGYSMAPYSSGVYFACSVLNSTSILIGSQTFTFLPNIEGMALVNYDASGNVLNAITLDGGGDDNMDICLDNGCALYLGGDIETLTVTIGSSVLTHTTAEAVFIAKLRIGSTPTINVTGNFSICAGTSATLQANGASNYTWSTGALGSNVVVTPATNSVYVVTGSSSQFSCTASISNTVFVAALPTLTLNPNSSVVCRGSSITLSAGGANQYSWTTGSQTSLTVVNPSVSANYTVTGSNASGCSTLAIASVSVIALPILTLTPSSTLICKGQTVKVQVSGANTYTWNNAAQTSSIIVTATANATYSVSGTNSVTGCTGNGIMQLTVSSCTGIDDNIGHGLYLSVSPNPAQSQIQISSANNINLVLRNILGQPFTHLKLRSGEAQSVDVSLLKEGIYFLQDENGTRSQKIIISR